MSQNSLGGVLAITAVAILIVASCFTLFTDANNYESITVTDGHGVTNVFDEPVQHIVAYGIGTNEILVKIGATDKIVVCDKYVTTSAEKCLEPLQKRISEGKTLANGSAWGETGRKEFNQNVAEMMKNGCFDGNRDVVFLLGTSSSYEAMKNLLTGTGCKHIVAWDKTKTYEDIIKIAENISEIATGGIAPEVDQMSTNYLYIKNETGGMEKVNAFYVTFSGDNFKVGNYGSKANAILEAANANVITNDESVGEETYYTSIAELVAEYNYDVIVFADETSIINDREKLQMLKHEVSDSVEIYCMKSLWNNFSISSSDGLWNTASIFYPGHFGEPPKPIGVEMENALPYMFAGLATAIVVGVASIYFLRD